MHFHRKDKYPEGVLVASSLDDALSKVTARDVSPPVETAFVIGGSQSISDALAHPATTHVFLTKVCKEFECDVFMPAVDPSAFRVITEQVSQLSLIPDLLGLPAGQRPRTRPDASRYDCVASLIL